MESVATRWVGGQPAHHRRKSRCVLSELLDSTGTVAVNPVGR
jgi:hypothetical protein